MGEYSKALVDYEYALELLSKEQQSDFAWIWTGKSIVLLRMKRKEEALEAARKVLQINPAYVGGHQALSSVLIEMHRYDEVKAVHQRILELAPEEAWTYGNIGWHYCKMGEFEVAVEKGQRAIDMAPDDAMLHYNLALFNLAKGDAERAFEVYQQAIEIDSDLRVIGEAIKDIVEAQERWPGMSQLRQGLDFLNEAKAKGDQVQNCL